MWIPAGLAQLASAGATTPGTGTVSSTNITVKVSNQGRSASFAASVQLPSTGSGPFPAVIVLAGLGADTTTILNSGVAVINYDPMQVGTEGTPRNNKQGAFYSIYGSSSSTGLLMAWAWGVSRIVDVIQQSGGNVLRGSSIGVTGCSRFGKGAFVSGVFDQRIALTMPIESGTDGVPILRGVPGESGAQPLGEAYLTVTNTGSTAINGWTLGFTVASSQTFTNGWNATFTGSTGQVTGTNLSYNASIPPNGTVTLGFQRSTRLRRVRAEQLHPQRQPVHTTVT